MPHEDPDRAMVERAQGGDQDAMSELLQRYRDPVFAFVYRMLNQREAAEDVAQDTFVRVFQRLHTFRFRRDARFSTWLFQLARHAALDELRRRRRRPTAGLEELAHEPRANAPDAGQALIHREMGEALARAVATLPEEQRTALVLTEYHGLEAAEVARVLRCTVRGAESRLFRARQAVREQLARRGWL